MMVIHSNCPFLMNRTSTEAAAAAFPRPFT